MNRVFYTASLLVFLFLFSSNVLGMVGNNVQIQTSNVANGVLVKFKTNVSNSGKINSLSSAGLKEMEKFRLVPGLTHAQVLSGQTLEETMQTLRANPNVEYVEPNYIVTVQETLPNDPQFPSLYGLHNTVSDADIDAPEAWDIQTGSPEVVIAVIDSGVDYTHEDLQGNIWTNPGEIPDNGIDDDGNGYVDDYRGWDFANDDNDPMDDHFHGTHVAGTIAAVGNNGIGVTGINWKAKIMPLKFLGAGGNGGLDAAIRAIEYAVSMGAQISNNSWGAPVESQALREAIANAERMGHLFVAAAGNDSSDNDTKPTFPASFDLPNIISVAATDRNDKIAAFSNYGATAVDLGAPGVDIISLSPDNGYRSLNGTSMASPHVAGAAGLLLAQDPSLSYAELKAALLNNVDPTPALQGITTSGGRLNVFKALTSLTGQVRIAPLKATVPLQATLQFSASLGTEPYTWSVSNTSVGTIDADSGLFVATGVGTTKILVTDANGDSGTSGDISVTQTTVAPETATLAVNQKLQFTASGGSAPYTWRSSDSSIASVNNNGTVTGIDAGIVLITATDANGVSATTGNVEIISTQLVLTPAAAVLGVGSVLNFSVSGGTPPYSWATNNNDVATIDASGSLTAKAAGKVTVSVTDAQGFQGLSGVIEVRKIVIDPPAAQIKTAENLQFTASGGLAPYTWTVSNPNFAKISADGLLTGVASGTVIVSATDRDGAQGFTGQIVIDGTGRPEIYPRGANLRVGEQVKFSATGGTPPYRWASSNPGIASIVADTGLLTATGAGKVFIVVTDKLGRSESIYTITVRDVVVNPAAATISVGESLQLSATGGLAPYTWRVDTPTVLGIDSRTGVVIGKSAGTAIVKAIGVDGIFATSQITVVDNGAPPPVTPPLSLTPESAFLNIGDTLQFVASGGTGRYTFSSSDPSIASFNANNGLLTALGTGVVNVTVSDGQTSITSGSIEVRNLVITPQTASIQVGETLGFSASGGVEPYTWSVNKTTIAKIDTNGVLTGLAAGNVLVTVKDADEVTAFTGTITITGDTTQPYVEPQTAQLNLGETLQFSLVGARVNYWQVTNPLVASINSYTGLLTALRPGVTKVKVIDVYGKTYTSDDITIEGTVTQPLSITPNFAQVTVGESITFKASGGTGPYKWSSLNTVVATIDENGVLETKASGITAVSVQDAAGRTASSGLILVSPSSNNTQTLSILPETAIVPRGGWLQFSAQGGVAPYTWSVENTDLGTITATSGFFQANFLYTGTTKVMVTDANGDVVESGEIEIR
jgi:subtilisin family serine protease